MSRPCSILIIDDEAAMRHLLHTILEDEGYSVDEAKDGKEGLSKVFQQHYDLVLCDVRMPTLDGLGFLRQALPQHPDLTVIIMSAYGSLDTALDCIKNGAYDYISKPFRPDEIVLTLKKALERLRLQQENNSLRQELNFTIREQHIIGDSPVIKKVLQQIEALSQVVSPVLIHGETGTGKELVARALHNHSRREKFPFIAVNCSAISPQLVESELFGHCKGAFTGATNCHDGLFYAADGGTLFLDEIGELPLEFQPKLLRALQEMEIRPIGSTKPRKIDVRIIAATAKDLRQAIQEGSFREDLYYRLAVVELTVPSLRTRPEDIAQLCTFFLRRIVAKERRPTPELSDAALDAMKQYPWPGNVRELQNVIEKTMIFFRGTQIKLKDLPQEIHSSDHICRTVNDNLSLKIAIEKLERSYIEEALLRNNGNRTLAAKQLEISLRSLHYKIKEYNL